MLEILSYKMSSVAVERPTKMNAIDKKENENNKTRKIFNNSHKKHNKHEENRHFKFGRKRSQSFTGNSGKFFPPYKRRKKEGHIVPPTKFLLGGNICDPLNLNSMQDEEVNRAMNAVTPISSPLPTPKHRKGTIEVIIPPNIHDPLNLINCNDNDEYEKQLISPVKKNTKKKKKKKFKKALNLSEKVDESIRSEESVTSEKDKVEDNTIDTETPDAQKINSPSKLPPTQSQEIKAETQSKEKNKLKLKGLDEIKDKRLRKLDSKDKIVSPVIPQPGMFGWKSRTQHYKHYDRKKKNSKSNFHSKNVKFPYGNYLRYYGYRNPDNSIDSRLKVFAQRKRLFFRKDILDIGCNIGHITISIARDFGAKSVTGIDIDKTLTNIARTNIKHYVNCIQSPVYNENGEHKARDANFFPISMPINYGPIDIPGFTKKDHKGFPHNVTFVQGNYVLENDSLLTLEQPQFDVILCLSVTKWVHLNFGDEGLKTSFKRMYAQLRPGGVLLLEPQAWDTYQKRKHLSEQMCINYHKIELRPENFTQYLLSPEVGFSTCEVISVPPNPSKGFQRPIYLYEKAISRRQNSKDLELEQKAYERSLFPASSFCDNASTSQRSIESITQYEQLENVYAPCATPCFTPLHNTDSLSADLDLKCVEPDSTVKSEEDLNVQKISPKIETNENSSENTAIVTTTTINCTDSVIEQKFENCETQDDKT